MNALDQIKLPEVLKTAKEAKMKYQVGELGDFDDAFKQNENMLDAMENVHLHQVEEVDNQRARLM